MYRSTHRLKIQSAIAGATLFFCGIVSGHFIVPVIVHPVQAVQTKINQMDVVLQWNDIALNLIRTDKTSPPMAARNLAMLHTSIYDAVKPDPSVNLSPRSFSRITQAAEEAGMRRIYGGAHWPSDNRDGLAAGRALGTYVMQRL